MVIVVSILLILDLALLVALMIGWRLALRTTPTPDAKNLEATVVVAVRNEASGITRLLSDLTRQTYQPLSIIVVDDHSSDDTLAKAREYALLDHRVLILQSDGVGKKAALASAIHHASGDLILTTDGDCRVGPRWVESLSRSFADPSMGMMFGPVRMSQDEFFGDLQAMEFLSLVGSAASLAGLGYPVLCNGANLAFKKSAFYEVGGYSDSLHLPSGDDVLLLQNMVRRGIKVGFAADQEAIVSTEALRSFADLVNQRIRWAGKWRAGTLVAFRILALLVVAAQCATLMIPILFVFLWPGFLPALLLVGLWVAKGVMECCYLREVARFTATRWNWRVFFVLLLVYPLYTTFTGFASNFRSYRWKGRNLQSVGDISDHPFWSRG